MRTLPARAVPVAVFLLTAAAGTPAVALAAGSARQDIDRIELVMKGGALYDPVRIEAALGISPRGTRL